MRSSAHRLKCRSRIVFSRGVAWLLVVLITVPFTAPFSTCDLSLLLPASHEAPAAHLAVSEPGRSASIAEAVAAQPVASVLEEEQFKSTLLANASNIESLDVRSVVAARPVALVSILRTPLIALRL